MFWEIIQLLGSIVLTAGVLIVVIFFYFLPTYIAYDRQHPDRSTIFWINLFFGGSFFGWIICLIWALKKNNS